MKYLIALILLIVIPSQAMAKQLTVTYGLYASGFNVVEIEGQYDITDTTYDLTMDLKTAGMLSALAPWSGIIQSNGLYKGGKPSPLHHSFASTWRGKTETTKFDFDNQGRFKKMTLTKDDGTIKTDPPTNDVYADHPIDMLTAMFRAANHATCNSTQPAFDKKRRFDMVFTSKGADTLKKSDYNIFEGNAEICEVEIVPVAGKWREKPRGWMSIQGQAKENGQLPRLWFAKIRDDMPRIPVKFFIKTNYGAMIMHLKDIKE